MLTASALGVFINCPNDEGFRPQLNAIILTCVAVGLSPVVAGSSGPSGRPRLERILGALNACRYSVHDLSRCRGEGEENLARFNMPLELGMAMAIRGSPAADGAHEYLVLVPEEARLHRRYISDLAGLDPQTHDGSQPRIVAEVLAWLPSAANVPAEIGPDDVIEKLPHFDAAFAELRDTWRGGSVPWPRVVEAAARIAHG